LVHKEFTKSLYYLTGVLVLPVEMNTHALHPRAGNMNPAASCQPLIMIIRARDWVQWKQPLNG